MATSFVRRNIPADTGENVAEKDLKPYLVFTQLRIEKPFVSAGWVDAADDRMAMQFGRHHYGRDQKVHAIWVIAREHIGATDPEFPVSEDCMGEQSFQVFTQGHFGATYNSAFQVTASSSAEALKNAVDGVDDMDALHCVMVVPAQAIQQTDDDDLVWPLSDQGYRLARGYSRDVRQKWESLRKGRDLEVYEQDDLKETF